MYFMLNFIAVYVLVIYFLKYVTHSHKYVLQVPKYLNSITMTTVILTHTFINIWSHEANNPLAANDRQPNQAANQHLIII
jgi:hypothetical protein